jgi:hypothetical protein
METNETDDVQHRVTLGPIDTGRAWTVMPADCPGVQVYDVNTCKFRRQPLWKGKKAGPTRALTLPHRQICARK